MSATGFQPDPSANAPWTRTMLRTGAVGCATAMAGREASRAAVRCARTDFMKRLLTIEKLGSLLRRVAGGLHTHVDHIALIEGFGSCAGGAEGQKAQATATGVSRIAVRSARSAIFDA